MFTVLIVEADAVVRNLTIRVLTQRGFKVYEAASADEALDLCRFLADEPPDLLIADQATMGRDPERIGAICPNAKMIHISGWPVDAVEGGRNLLPGSSFLQKPFTPMQLVEAVQTTLNPKTH